MPDRKLGRFGTLLASLVVLLAVTPFAQVLQINLPASRMLSSVVLLVGVYSLRQRTWVFRAGVALAIVAFASSWLSQRFDVTALVLLDFSATSTFLMLLTAQILSAMLAVEKVTLDTVMGGICIYMLIGMIWVSLYSALEYAVPGSYTMAGVAVSELPDALHEAHRYPELMYFSFVTLTTLGYGDIVPTHAIARALATGEAVLGQVYLAVFVASLVGLHLADRVRRDGSRLP